jgi:ribosomal protein S18 acetylase RimI-like enzyme
VEKEKIILNKAQIRDINDIYLVLSKAFEPYKNNYTKGAYDATVLSPENIKNRILGKEYEIFVVIISNRIIGTFSISQNTQDQFYLRSMAIHPDYQRRGIGLYILKEIIRLGKRKNIKMIYLDTSKTLKGAIKFYKKFGFIFTGAYHNFFGIKIYEMIKKL